VDPLDAWILANDLFELDLNKLDPVAICQNLSCEIERIMGIFPNVPNLTFVCPSDSAHE
jgi:hypothetical protein